MVLLDISYIGNAKMETASKGIICGKSMIRLYVCLLIRQKLELVIVSITNITGVWLQMYLIVPIQH